MQCILWSCTFSEFTDSFSVCIPFFCMCECRFSAACCIIHDGSRSSLSWSHKRAMSKKNTKMHCFLHCHWIILRFFSCSPMCNAFILILFLFFFSLHFPSSCVFPDRLVFFSVSLFVSYYHGRLREWHASVPRECTRRFLFLSHFRCPDKHHIVMNLICVCLCIYACVCFLLRTTNTKKNPAI